MSHLLLRKPRYRSYARVSPSMSPAVRYRAPRIAVFATLRELPSADSQRCTTGRQRRRVSVKCVLGERKGDKNYRCHRHRGTVWEQVRSIYRNFRRDADDDRDGSHSNRDDCFLFFFSSPLASSPPRHARRADIVPHHGSRVSFSLPLSCFPLFSRECSALGRRDEKPPTKPREAPCVQDERALVVAATISVSEAAPGAATRRGLRRRPDTTTNATATAAALPQVNFLLLALPHVPLSFGSSL